MSGESNTNGTKGVLDVVEAMRQEFLDELIETIGAFDLEVDAARQGRVPAGPLLDRVRRAAVRLRGPAGTFSLHRIAAVSHRLDEYLAHCPKVPPPRLWEDLLAFFDVLLRLAEGRETEGDDSAQLVRRLPAKIGFELTDIEVREVEVLLVMSPGLQTRFVERELQQCGYRVSVVPDSLVAFPIIVQTKPDLVIISAMMPALEGIDLAVALSAMPSTRNIPLAVITSLDPDDEALRHLPKRVPVLFKGPSFADDLFRALDDLFLI